MVTQAEVLNLFSQVSAIKDSDQFLMVKSNANGTVTAAKITAELLRAYLAAGYAVTIDEDGYICIGGVRTEYRIIPQDGGGGSFDEKGRYIITSDGQRYLVPTVLLTAPMAPSITKTSYIVVTGTFDVAVTNNTPGATMYYRLDNAASWTPVTQDKVTVDSGFTNSASNSTHSVILKLKAVLNGEESGESTYTLNVTPKVAAGTVTVTPANDPYATEATITFGASPTAGATSSYKLTSSPWTEFTPGASVQTVTVHESAGANYYRVKAAKGSYVDSDEVGNAAFTLNKPRIYWAVVDALPASDAEVKQLANALKRDTFPTVTLPSSGVQGKKLVLAYSKSTVGKDVTSLKIGGFDYEYTLSTVGSFRLCVYTPLAATAAGLTAVYS